MHQYHHLVRVGIIFPETVALNLDHLPGGSQFRGRSWVPLSSLLECINGKARVVPRISSFDIFTKYAVLSPHNNGDIRMVWYSCMEDCFLENIVPTEWRAEFYILEEWARHIDRVVTCRAFLDRQEREAQMV